MLALTSLPGVVLAGQCDDCGQVLPDSELTVVAGDLVCAPCDAADRAALDAAYERGEVF